ncbi:MAG: putative hydrolase of the HAD superfamily [Paracoccaceae bacterium]|jgi:putative hydrolase of the HAD superfamily
MKALVLDFGGVISRTLFETHDQTEAALGLNPGSLTWRGPFDVDNDALWRSMQRDEITERDYWRARTLQVAKLVGQDWREMSDFVVAARGADPLPVIRPEAISAIKTAHASGHKLAILSNELDLFYGKEFREKLPFLKDFDVIVDATYTGILKPDPRAYRDCIDQLDMPAQDCIFVDDQLRNIHGGQSAGMQTVHFDVKNPALGYATALKMLDL